MGPGFRRDDEASRDDEGVSRVTAAPAIAVEAVRKAFGATVALEYDRLAWLRDHTWRGAGLLPAVVSLSMMMEAAQFLEPGAPVVSVHSFALREAVILRPRHSQTLTVEAERMAIDAYPQDATIAIQVRILSSGRSIHSAIVKLGTLPECANESEEPASEVTKRLQQPLIYERFFHGPSFQVLDHVDVAGAEAIGHSVALAESIGVDLPVAGRCSIMAREVALQTVGAYFAFERSEAFRRDVESRDHAVGLQHESSACADLRRHGALRRDVSRVAGCVDQVLIQRAPDDVLVIAGIKRRQLHTRRRRSLAVRRRRSRTAAPAGPPANLRRAAT